MKQPCERDCPNRSVTCHSECEKYKAFTEEIKSKRDEKQKKTCMDCFTFDRVMRVKKRINKR